MSVEKICKCGHYEAEHTITSGPNSNHQYVHNLCGHGASHFPMFGEVITRCKCKGFKVDRWATVRSRFKKKDRQ